MNQTLWVIILFGLMTLGIVLLGLSAIIMNVLLNPEDWRTPDVPRWLRWMAGGK